MTNKKAIENRSHFAQVPAVIHADEVIVQSENIRQLYIESIVKLTGENSRKLFEEKIKGTGSPKIEKIRSMSKDEIAVPEIKKKEIGIYDDTADMDRAIIIADAYYGDASSLVTLCKAVKLICLL